MDTSLFKSLKEQNMVPFLERLGHLPKKKNGNAFWYLSPFRQEQTPSFKVSAGQFGIDLFWDYGTGEHGNLVDFCCKYYCLTAKGLYQRMISDGPTFFFDQQNHSKILASQKEHDGNSQGIIINEIKSLVHPALIQYFKTRAILPEIYMQYCNEIHYTVGNRQFFAVGFSNVEGGWELRNAYFKGASSPKSFSRIERGSESVILFEGFMDFLSLMVIRELAPDHLKELPLTSDYIILNSLALWNKCRPVLDSYSQINLFLDRDDAGILQTKNALAIGNQFLDRSELFVGAKDVNDWLAQQRQLKIAEKPDLIKIGHSQQCFR